ncbi:MAG TPA: carbon-nitrogen hydrolase family protein [Epsilonproteobacteria bacterium]|nr:carbon-nitrogen hydrolase family protein [Campylobacterota bacterium]
MKKIAVAAIQLPTLGFNSTRLEFYFKNAHDRGVNLVLFGEYVLNHFFKELKDIPLAMVQEQTIRHIEILQAFAKRYNLTIIAPVVVVKKDKYIKSIAKITPKRVAYREQQILISYKHWNEERFFSNQQKPLSTPMFFIVEGFRVMVMSGFEIHFPEIWRYVRLHRIDLVLTPTSSTFGSHNRWREVLKTQAFLHSCYVLRANRLGEYSEHRTKWRFYGDSMLISPDGQVEMVLEDKESMLVEEIDKQILVEARKAWKFDKIIKLKQRIDDDR